MNSGISRFLSFGAWWKVEFGEEAEWGEGDLGEGFGGEFLGVAGEDDGLDLRVGLGVC